MPDLDPPSNPLSRVELLRLAQGLGVVDADVMTRAELRAAIDKAQRPERPSADQQPVTWVSVARRLLASVVERGLNLPDAAALIRGDTKLTAPPKAPPPVATVTLARIYAAQGHLARAIGTLDEVLLSDPDHELARDLRDQLELRRAELAARHGQGEVAGEVAAEPPEDPLSGEPLGGGAPGGEPLSGEPVGGEPLSGEPVGGEALGGEPVGVAVRSEAAEHAAAGVSSPRDEDAQPPSPPPVQSVDAAAELVAPSFATAEAQPQFPTEPPTQVGVSPPALEPPAAPDLDRESEPPATLAAGVDWRTGNDAGNTEAVAEVEARVWSAADSAAPDRADWRTGNDAGNTEAVAEVEARAWSAADSADASAAPDRADWGSTRDAGGTGTSADAHIALASSGDAVASASLSDVEPSPGAAEAADATAIADGSVADGSVADGSVADGSVADGRIAVDVETAARAAAEAASTDTEPASAGAEHASTGTEPAPMSVEHSAMSVEHASTEAPSPAGNALPASNGLAPTAAPSPAALPPEELPDVAAVRAGELVAALEGDAAQPAVPSILVEGDAAQPPEPSSLETDAARATEAAAATDVPAATELPPATEAAAATDVPPATDVPDATDVSAATDVPAATELPATTEAAAATDVPAATDVAADSEVPRVTAAPVVTEPPATEAPAVTEAREATALAEAPAAAAAIEPPGATESAAAAVASAASQAAIEPHGATESAAAAVASAASQAAAEPPASDEPAPASVANGIAPAPAPSAPAPSAPAAPPLPRVPGLLLIETDTPIRYIYWELGAGGSASPHWIHVVSHTPTGQGNTERRERCFPVHRQLGALRLEGVPRQAVVRAKLTHAPDDARPLVVAGAVKPRSLGGSESFEVRYAPHAKAAPEALAGRARPLLERASPIYWDS